MSRKSQGTSKRGRGASNRRLPAVVCADRNGSGKRSAPAFDCLASAEIGVFAVTLTENTRAQTT